MITHPKKSFALSPSGKEQALENFYRQLKWDGTSASELAEQAGVGRAYLTRVLGGHESGERTWFKVMPLLSAKAVSHVKQCSAWNIHAERAWAWVETIRALQARIVKIETDFGTVSILQRPAHFQTPFVIGATPSTADIRAKFSSP